MYLIYRLRVIREIQIESNNTAIGQIKMKEFEKKEAEAISASVLEYLDVSNKRLNNIKVFSIDLKLNGDFKNDSAIRLSNIFNEKKIVFRFFQTSCITCVLDEIKNLNLLAKRIGKEKVVLITDNLSKDILTICLASNINLNIYETRNKNFGLIYDKKQTPYLFLLDRDLLIQKPFIVSTLGRGLSKKFYESIEDSF